MIKIPSQSTLFILILIMLICLSVVKAYYEYVLASNFDYFLTEEDVPDRFDLTSY